MPREGRWDGWRRGWPLRQDGFAEIVPQALLGRCFVGNTNLGVGRGRGGDVGDGLILGPVLGGLGGILQFLGGAVGVAGFAGPRYRQRRKGRCCGRRSWARLCPRPSAAEGQDVWFLEPKTRAVRTISDTAINVMKASTPVPQPGVTIACEPPRYFVVIPLIEGMPRRRQRGLSAAGPSPATEGTALEGCSVWIVALRDVVSWSCGRQPPRRRCGAPPRRDGQVRTGGAPWAMIRIWC